MKQTDPQYKLRLPQDLKEQIEAAAKESGRSMNAEIVARLERSFAPLEDKGEALTALALRLAQTESELAISKMESQLHILDANFAATVAVAAADFNAQLGHPHPVHKTDWKELLSIYEQTNKAIDETPEVQFQTLMDQAEAAINRSAHLRQDLTSAKRRPSLKKI